MLKKAVEIVFIVLLAIIPPILIWLTFFYRVENVLGIPLARSGMATIVSNYDGPLYIVVAKTLYNLSQIARDYQFPLSLEYYAAHFPLFPLLIKAFAPIFQYPYSMLFVTLASGALSLYFFNKLISEFVTKTQALWITLVFAIFPARWLIVRSVGSPEPLFVGSIIASIHYFRKKNYLLAAVWGAVAQLTKSPAILLFIAYLVAWLLPKLSAVVNGKIKSFKFDIKFLLIFLIPISLVAVFGVYSLPSTFGNFFAYFNSGDNIHLLFPPFQIFNYSAPWVGTFWLEEIIFIYLIGAIAIFRLIQKNETVLAIFTGIFFASLIFVSHRDLMRYALPVIPFVYVAFSDYLVKKEFKIIFAFLIIPTFLFALAFISQNVMPISNWGPLL